MLRVLGTVAVVGALIGGGVNAQAQSLTERIDQLRRERSQTALDDEAAALAATQELERRLDRPINVSFDALGVRAALGRWAARARVPLVIDWAAMEADGVDAQMEVTFAGEGVAAQTVLLHLMDQMSVDQRFIAEVRPWGVTLMTRTRANRDVVAQVYDVKDLLVAVPQFMNAPSFDLRAALSNTGSGGGGGGESGLFDDEGDEQAAPVLTRAEREEQLAQMIRAVIEPDVWQANGGAFSRLRIRNGLLIVRAPRYVHQQIGRPVFRATR